ncbi:hypothetical protein [Spirosoma litoris]
MKAQKYRQLTEVHLLHRIWRSDLELALQEVNFWEALLGTLSEGLGPTATDADSWKEELSQLHHFRRLINRLLEEIQTIEKQVAAGVQFDHILDPDTRLNHQYLRQEMDSFHTDFRAFKTDIRHYMVALPTF